MRMLLLAALLFGGVGCAMDDDPGPTCTFASGRTCGQGETCLGGRGNECNYYTCDREGRLLSTALICEAGPPPTGAPSPTYQCDPRFLMVGSTPPPAPCPIGELRSITATGGWGACVSTLACEPMACDPQFAGDGCPTYFACDVGGYCVFAPPP